MSASFEQAIRVILEHEGGLTRDANDRGGITNYGITLPILKELGMAGDLNHDGYIDARDIEGMSLDEAKEIYRQRWWDRFGYGTLPTQGVATKVFDGCVNFGWYQGHINLQRSLNMFESPSCKLKLDGHLGVKTFGAVQRVTELGHVAQLINHLRVAMAYVYGQIVAKDPSQADFHLGWLRRATW